MMEKLLDMAKKVCDKAEVYSHDYSYAPVSFKDAKLHDIQTKFQSGLSIRIIKDGKLGFAYTRNLIDREELIANALDSLKGGVEAEYDFPLTKDLPNLSTYDPALESVSATELVQECTRVCDLLKSRTEGEIEMSAFCYTEKTRIINTEGTDVSTQSGFYGMYGGVVYPGSASGIIRSHLSKRFEKTPDDVIDEVVDLYGSSAKVVELKGGKMKALFMPNSMYSLNWRILSGTSAKSIYEKISPIAGKIGEKIFSDKLTIYDDPLDDSHPEARAFDDEGVACKPLTIIDGGVLKNFYYDLHYATKLESKSTGHGHRVARWGGDSITLKPTPSLSHLRMATGDKSFRELVGSIDRGVIIEGALGAHSGNIPNGDYSIGLSPGLYVENGEIRGRVKDVMVAGNVYETLKKVIDVGSRLYPSFSGEWVAPMLIDDVSVAAKG
jgi:PmbA protein